jgi:SAM-dependent methyltransferase|tara:strand:- start:6512 stop:7147 length:636 start_codon:yes stop_codon:yes gene_type:complete
MAFEKNYTVTLSDDAFRRADEAPDEKFYAIPRFTSHIDCFAIDAVTDLYRKYLPKNADILDLMSSLLSHLPEDVSYQRVVGLGMNARELANNKQLTETVVHDLNNEPTLPFDDDEFSAGLLCVSIDYLIHPVAVLKEMGRVLKTNSPLIISYSDRFFETKATAAWLSLTDEQRGYLIKSFLVDTGCYDNIQMTDCSPEFGDPLYAIVALVV